MKTGSVAAAAPTSAVQIFLILAVGKTDNAASDLFPGIACRLGLKVIGHLVDDHGFAQDLRDDETLVVERDPGVALVGEQGQQISHVLGVRGAGGI